MKRTEKEVEVKNLSEKFKGADLMVLADFCGLTVAEVSNLRSSLRELKAEVKVVKNSLAQIAVKDSELQFLSNYFAGNVAVVTVNGDPVNPAKALVKFAKDLEKFKLKVGVLSGKELSPSALEALSKLPSREQMLSSLLGSMKAPAQNLVGVLVALPRKLVTVLAAIRDKKQS